MDAAIQSLARIIRSEYPITDEALAKLTAILMVAAKNMAEQMVKEAADSLLAMGIEPSHFSWHSFLGYAAHQQMQKLDMVGLLRRDKLFLHHTADIKKAHKKSSAPAISNDLLNEAFFLDVVDYTMRHFLPIDCLLTLVSEPSAIEKLPAGDYTTPAPYSSEAVKCVSGLNSISYAIVKTRPVALEPVGVEEILQEVTLKVDEAARIIRVAPKTLEDMCRDGRYPESGYTRYAEGGTYHFPTDHVVEFAKRRNIEPHKSRR